jgi:hypothetical protein
MPESPGLDQCIHGRPEQGQWVRLPRLTWSTWSSLNWLVQIFFFDCSRLLERLTDSTFGKAHGCTAKTEKGEKCKPNRRWYQMNVFFDLVWISPSSTVSIRQHTPAYVSIPLLTEGLVLVEVAAATAVGMAELESEHDAPHPSSLSLSLSLFLSLSALSVLPPRVQVRKEESTVTPRRMPLHLVSIRQHTSSYVSMRKESTETPRRMPLNLVSIRQHTSAYVRSGRRSSRHNRAACLRTSSAYGSIRQHTFKETVPVGAAEEQHGSSRKLHATAVAAYTH